MPGNAMTATVALVSAQVRGEILAQDPAVPLVFKVLSPGAALPLEALQRVDLAFVSLDLIGDSTGTQLAPELRQFFDALRAAQNLHWLHVCSAGADRPVFTELLARGVRLTTSSGASAAQVSQTALMGFLALVRQLPRCVAAQQRREWSPLKGPHVPRDIAGQTVVVVGLGPIGREIARLLQAMGVRVIGVRRTNEPAPCCERVVAFEQIDDVLCEADGVILACPATPQTRGLVDTRRIALMRRGVQLVNVARGVVVVQDALLDALHSGQVGGAFLDVFSTEPLPTDSPLWSAPNTLISPHSAGYATGTHARTVRMFLDNLARLTSGQALHNEVRSTT